MIDDLRDKLFKTRSQQNLGGLAIALRLASPARIYISQQLSQLRLASHPAARAASSQPSIDHYCKHEDYPYKTLYIAATPGYRYNCAGLALLPQSRPRAPMSATVSRAGSTRNKLLWAQPRMCDCGDRARYESMFIKNQFTPTMAGNPGPC